MFKICLLHILKSELRPTDQKKKKLFKNVTARWQCTWSPKRSHKDTQQEKKERNTTR